jgi:transposase-like protein
MIFERYRRMEISLEEALVEMYLLGISTRKVGDAAEALCDFTLSSSAQSRLNKKVYEKHKGMEDAGHPPGGPLPVA